MIYRSSGRGGNTRVVPNRSSERNGEKKVFRGVGSVWLPQTRHRQPPKLSLPDLVDWGRSNGEDLYRYYSKIFCHTYYYTKTLVRFRLCTSALCLTTCFLRVPKSTEIRLLEIIYEIHQIIRDMHLPESTTYRYELLEKVYTHRRTHKHVSSVSTSSPRRPC